MKQRSAPLPDSNRTSHQDGVAKHELDEWLDQALADTFPASDPIASPPGGGGGASDTGAQTRNGEFRTTRSDDSRH